MNRFIDRDSGRQYADAADRALDGAKVSRVPLGQLGVVPSRGQASEGGIVDRADDERREGLRREAAAIRQQFAARHAANCPWCIDDGTCADVEDGHAYGSHESSWRALELGVLLFIASCAVIGVLMATGVLS